MHYPLNKENPGRSQGFLHPTHRRISRGQLRASLVGESEKKIRQATKVIESFGECVVFLDELEKSFSGVKSSGETDAGTTSGMFSHFLTFLQEHRSPVFVMATANDVTRLPPETMRAGRFDAIFLADLPSLPERVEIIRIMNRRYGTEIAQDMAQGLTGWRKKNLCPGNRERYMAVDKDSAGRDVFAQVQQAITAK
ncbi:MAG: AAA family ATPase [Desulfovibrionaceae bacterium]|nr:AAA family ATPase [Desulfovibrionaceae bacterium]